MQSGNGGQTSDDTVESFMASPDVDSIVSEAEPALPTMNAGLQTPPATAVPVSTSAPDMSLEVDEAGVPEPPTTDVTADEGAPDSALTMTHETTDTRNTTDVTLDLGARGTVRINVSNDGQGTAVAIHAASDVARELGDSRDDIARMVNGVAAISPLMPQQIQINVMPPVIAAQSSYTTDQVAQVAALSDMASSGDDSAPGGDQSASTEATTAQITRFRRRFVNVFV